jgi:hypothetical protein
VRVFQLLVYPLDRIGILGSNPGMDIPKFKDIKKGTRIQIRGPQGPFTFYVIRATRGGEGQLNTLTLYGNYEPEISFGDQCYVSFGGGEIMGSMEHDSKIITPGIFAGTFVTIISSKDFWE